jgi:hypothetical protein
MHLPKLTLSRLPGKQGFYTYLVGLIQNLTVGGHLEGKFADHLKTGLENEEKEGTCSSYQETSS